MNDHTRIIAVIAVFALLALAPAGAAWAQERGRCVTADVPFEIVLPDESRHAAGQVRICLSRKYSPVSGLHTAYVDGKATGMYISRSAMSEGRVADGEPFLLFRRNEAGSLALHGYAVPAGDGHLTSYRFRESGGSIDVAQRGGSLSVVLLAAITE